LARHPSTADRPWLSELARLERAHLELFDGPDARALTIEEVRATPAAELAGIVLRAIPCHAVMRTRFSVSPLWNPGAAQPPAERPETLVVGRQALTVFHRRVPADEAALLPLLAAGATFEAVCGRLAELAPEDTVVARAFELLGQWVGDGLIMAPSAVSQ